MDIMTDDKVFELSEQDLIKAYKSLIYDRKALFEFQKALYDNGIVEITLSGPPNCPDVILTSKQCLYVPHGQQHESP